MLKIIRKICQFHCSSSYIHLFRRPVQQLSARLDLRSFYSGYNMEYPKVRRDDSVVEEYHGMKVADPYRWLEDPDSDETKAFVEAQNALMEPHLNSYPHKEKMKKRLTEMWDYPKYGCPYRKGPRYFYSYNTGLQNHSVVYVQDSLDGEARVFLDPNTLSDDGTVAVAGKSFTKDGSMCAVALTASGSDWNTIKFMNVGTCEFMEDVLKKVKFSCRTWTRDNKGIFYNSYPHAEDHHEGKETTSNTHHSLYYHVMGTPQEQDVLCAEFPDQPNWMSGVQVSDCGNYLLLSISDGCDPVNRLYYSDLRTLSNGIDGILPWVKLIDNFDAEYDYITNEGTVFTFKSNLNAPKYKIINIDFSQSEPIDCKDLIPEEEDTLEDAICVNGKDLIVLYMHKVKHVMYACDLITGEKKYTFPLEIGSVAGITGRKEDVEIFYYFTSFLVPGTIFRCDMTADVLQPEIFREVKVQGVDTSLYDSDQVFYKSKDGTEIPMFLIKRKDVELNGENPLLLYGYGGFNVSLTPYFSNSRLFFVERFGVYAIANIRGGGEFGETWHKAGSFGCKQNVFDDFIAAAEYLIENKYTNSNKIVINGGSNGGLLVGACSNQRPDLFKVAVADVGVTDMLRFHKFTIGHAWITDFGCADKKEDFEYLFKYSPLHNVRVPVLGQYPATLLITGDHDDRVVPLHSFKLIATLQHTLGDCEKQTNPLIIRIETKAGHGAGKPTAKIIEELVDKYAFMAIHLGIDWTE